MTRLSAAARSRSPLEWAVLAVAVCGVIATAHGLFEVARGCAVPVAVAVLYVPITDGLALVAYASTERLRSWSRSYAWAVVLVAAGLSGTAQAVFLGGLGEPPVQLRYGVGAWPACAVAVAAHLLWLVQRPAAAAVADPVPSQVSVGETGPAVDSGARAPAVVEPVFPVVVEPVPALHETDQPAPVPVPPPRSRAVAAARSRRSQVSAAAGSRDRRPSRQTGPCVEGCGQHDGPVSYSTRKRCAERLATAPDPTLTGVPTP